VEGGWFSMKTIPLTQGKVALIDDEDFERVSQYKWCAFESGNTFYAMRRVGRKIGKGMMQMHRFILATPSHLQTDHIDRDGLNNQKINLRAVTPRQNQQNLRNGKSSRFPGVCWNKRSKSWMAYFWFRGRVRHLGYFKNEDDAHAMYRVTEAVLCQSTLDEVSE
jgi:hypothetical protein